MKNRQNYYRILQVQPDASQAVIQASYKAIMRELKVHPDLGGDHWNAIIVNEAYRVLGDRTRRTAYDRELFERYTKQPFDAYKQPVISYFCHFCKRPLARQATPEEACPACRSPLASNDVPAPFHNRRAVERVRKSGQVRIYTQWPAKPAVGQIVDLSPQGMRFQCDAQLRPPMTIKISSRDLKAVAVVRHAHKVFDHGTVYYVVGVQFLTVQFSQPKGGSHSSSA